MRLLDIVSLFILAVLIVGALFLVLIVAAIPGKLAKKRHGPWVEAINVAGWIGEKAHLHSTARPPYRHLITSRSHVHTNITSGERNAHEEFHESIWEVPFEFNQYFSMVYCGARIFVLRAFLCLHSVRAESRCEPLCFRCCDGNATIQGLVHSRASC